MVNVNSGNKNIIQSSSLINNNPLFFENNNIKRKTISLNKINYQKPILQCFKNINENDIQFICVDYDNVSQNKESIKSIKFNDVKKNYNLFGLKNEDKKINLDCFEEIKDGYKIISCKNKVYRKSKSKNKSDVWQELYDKNVNSKYWYNTLTGEATWINPHHGGKTINKKNSKHRKTKKNRK
jgi:hypothetical protein